MSGTCSKAFRAGTQVELTASTTTGAFLGWSDSCQKYGKCVLTMDQDRSVGALFGIPGQALWVQPAGSSGDDRARAIARDDQNHLIVVGQFRNSMKIGAATLISAGGFDVFVAKLDAETGDVLWAKGFGSEGDDLGQSVTVDDAGGIYIVGTFNGTVDFGGGKIVGAGNPDAFVAKLSPSGDYAWANVIEGSGFDEGHGVAVRGSAVVAVGFYQGTMTLNGMTATSAGEEDAFIVKYDTNGAFGWLRTLGGDGNDNPSSVAIDSAGNAVVVGSFSSTTNLGGQPLVSKGGDDVFVAKYSGSNGAHLLSKSFGTAAFESPSSVAVDMQDNIFLIGSYASPMDVGGPAPLPANGPTTRLYVVKYSLAGAYLWAESFGDTAAVLGESIATNAAGDIAMTGGFCGTLNFGGADLSSVRSCSDADQDIFAVRLSGTDGKHINSNRAGGTGLDTGWGVALSPDGRVFVAGSFQGFAEFGGQGVTSDGGSDAIVLGLAPL